MSIFLVLAHTGCPNKGLLTELFLFHVACVIYSLRVILLVITQVIFCVPRNVCGLSNSILYWQ